MSSRERRTSPRKECVMSLRFRIATNGHGPDHHVRDTTGGATVKASAYFSTIEAESVNLSERGIYFRSRGKVNIGEPLEMYFTIPRELTGRMAEHVRCIARVVHVESTVDKQGMLGVGAAVERFELVSAALSWEN
jgi:hypothetical protein